MIFFQIGMMTLWKVAKRLEKAGMVEHLTSYVFHSVKHEYSRTFKNYVMKNDLLSKAWTDLRDSSIVYVQMTDMDEFREETKRRHREAMHRYSEKYPERVKASMKKYYRNNKEHRRQYKREYYKKNRERVLEYNRRYKERLRERRKQEEND